MNSNKEKSLVWWGSLSIEQREQCYLKYKPYTTSLISELKPAEIQKIWAVETEDVTPYIEPIEEINDTLETAARKQYENDDYDSDTDNTLSLYLSGARFGANWQKEQHLKKHENEKTNEFLTKLKSNFDCLKKEDEEKYKALQESHRNLWDKCNCYEILISDILGNTKDDKRMHDWVKSRFDEIKDSQNEKE